MAPGGRGIKGKEIAQESEVQNVRGLADIIRGRRGRPRGQVAQNVEEEVNQEPPRPERHGARQVAIEQEVEQLTQKVGGMQLIIAQFQELRPPKFFGNESGEKAAGWLKSINHLFNFLEYSQDIRLKLAIYQLKDRAQLWWEATEEAMKDSSEIITWDAFRAHFTQEYAPLSYYAAKEEEFNQLVQGNKSVVEYVSQFSALLPYVPHVARNDQAKLPRFLHGFQRTVHTLVMTGSPNTYIQAVRRRKLKQVCSEETHSQVLHLFLRDLGVVCQCQWIYLHISLYSHTNNPNSRGTRQKEINSRRSLNPAPSVQAVHEGEVLLGRLALCIVTDVVVDILVPNV
ncbi:uncharacterized protein LOC142531744 [Primulina tabacum]|uniref:uncharacterized protein LOC142531744 n=1 Tax=Primulina tabacum TaxID=48773 RepID=UPI003F59213C